ncbi:SUPT6H,-like protein to suppressor of ty 6 [Thalassiosira pseudonana CCMP1335]|uniref:SUPT6H,-like protein to suppressor of ty 6 n=1 Tax=Thalassiosira pseudonana TaxID=35128 RepID=B8C8T3_THAPS|nr:SUPT6H,-like protein to suppressor of ty 6 [Thalassiosira pseudonana CCMP1335]EED89929.1 SUPT6H,-like protein to suppressor of ty 6 [Thalassiosira pseudonana CCMP1335]
MDGGANDDDEDPFDEDYMDEREGGMRRKSKKFRERGVGLRRAFEPVQLVENFCTEKDDAIRMADCPERYYDWRSLPVVGEEIGFEEEEEAMWIMGKIPAIQSEYYAISATNLENPSAMDSDEVEKKERVILESIVNSLRYMRAEKLEPDFIKRYRMDYVTSPAVRDNLYRIMDEDSEWERMTEARTKIETILNGFADEVKGQQDTGSGEDHLLRLKEELRIAQEKLDETVKDEERVTVELGELDNAKGGAGVKEEEDDDDELFGDDDEDDSVNKDKVKRSRRFDWDYYRTCVGEGLRGICYKFVLPPFRVGIKLEETLTKSTGFTYDRLVLLSSAREDAAWDDNPEMMDPLRGCRYVAAMELAHEPRIRRHLRDIYRAEACITTRPTAKGLQNIDAFHEYYGLHLLRNKHVKDHFPTACIQYLNLLKAERSGDITVQVHLPFVNDEMDTGTPWLMEALERVYMPANGDTEEWNDERRKILKMALVNYLLPHFEAETRRDLRDASTRIGVEAAAQNLQALAMEGPYRPSYMLGENRFIVPTDDFPIVGVCSATDPKDGTFLAAIDENGESQDHLAIPGGTSITSDNAREKVITFLMQTRPSLVVVDDEDFEARMDSFRMMHPNVDDDDDVVWKCNVDIVDDNVAQLFGRSVRGKKEFPDQPVNLKVAIATARWAKNPLCELAYTWSTASDAGVFGTEMLFMNIHPLQRLLPKPLLLRQYERVLCNVTAEVGVDINGACTYDHMHGMLSFVPGLGPRKANNLKQSVARIGGVVSSRKSLLAKRLLGPIIYNNAIAFLRVRSTDQLQDQMLHPLDDTRCHPDVYLRQKWAVKIAVDALELGDSASNDTDDYAISALRDVMQNSREEVEELDLDTFAEMIEQNGNGKWLSHLTMVKWEFRLPFEDPRKPMEPPTHEKLFKLLTGETDATLCPGKEVTGKVVKNGDFGSQVKLEGDVPGFIPLRNLADDHVGQIVNAIITEVKMDHMCCDLTLKLEDFKKKSSEWGRPASLPPLDNSFDREAALSIDADKAKAREEPPRSGKVTRRACAHPAFRNASHSEVDKELREAGDAMVGEALIRPSNKSVDSLAVHWMVRPGCIKVIEVLEEDKDTDASIGNRLIIKREVYESIDELLGRYIAPMNDRVEEVIHHRKFMDKLEDEVDAKIVEMKQAQPKGVFYHVCWSESYPGYVSLRFIMNRTPRNHTIGITPDGFAWGSMNFNSMDRLLNAFKKNPGGPGSRQPDRSLGGSTSGGSVSTSRQSTGMRTEDTSRQSRWGAPPPPTLPPPSRWGMPPPAGPPPSFAAPPPHSYQ